MELKLPNSRVGGSSETVLIDTCQNSIQNPGATLVFGEIHQLIEVIHSVGWNRIGHANSSCGDNMLEKVADNIWLAEGDLVNFHGFAYPTRSVIVQLAGDNLWVWSPIQLSGSLQAAIDRLGMVRHLVSPNKIHHLFLSDWHAAYPEALLWGPKSTIEKESELNFEGALTDSPPPEWNEEFDQVWFNGSKFMDEIVFFHRASRTVILADLSENFSNEFLRANWRTWQIWLAKIWGIVEGRGYAPLEWRFTFFDRQATRAARDQVLAWNATQVIMAHGEWQSVDGHSYLERSFSWIR